MDHNDLPRLSARIMETTPTHGPSDASNTAAVSSTKRNQQPRLSMPKSAGASSPQRRNTGGDQPNVRVFGVVNGDAVIDICKGAIPPDSFTRRRLNGHKTQPTVRPSSTRASPRQAHYVAGSNQVAFSDQQGVQHPEWAAVQGENEQLRREVSLLQQKLVEKMRGNSKILVSGGQFRAPTASLAARSPGSSQNVSSSGPGGGVQPCSNCISLRASFKKARDAADQEQRVLEYRIAQLEREESEAQASRNQHEEDLSSLRVQLHQALDHGALTEAKLNTKIDELQRMQDEYARLMNANESMHLQEAARYVTHRSEPPPLQQLDAETQTDECVLSQYHKSSENLVEVFRRQADETQAINAELEHSLEELRNQMAELKKQLTQTLQDQASERKNAHEELDKSQQECSILRCQNADLVAEVGSLQASIKNLEHIVTATEVSHGNLAACWHQQSLATEERLALLESQRGEASELSLAAGRRNTELEGLLSETVGKHQALESHVQVMARELEEVKRELCAKSEKLVTLEGHHGEKLAEILSATKALQVAQWEWEASREESTKLRLANGELLAQVAALESELSTRDEVHNQLKRSHAATLEKAMQSLVRLCVVAPTVNVHLSNNSGGVTSSSSVVTCRTTLPHKQVRMVVEQDVLPLFATVFVQPHEGCTAQGGPMDPWVQTLLRDMQESLATHLQKLYSATTAD